jgi:hypothetical protein
MISARLDRHSVVTTTCQLAEVSVKRDLIWCKKRPADVLSHDSHHHLATWLSW